jgi:hypothetical protein
MKRRLPRRMVMYPGETPLSPVRGIAHRRMRLGHWRRERQDRKAFRQAPFPLYGLPESWRGLRLVGGRGWTQGIGTSSLSLVHRSHAGPDASEIVVHVSRERGPVNYHKAEIEKWVRLRGDFEGEPIRESEWMLVQILVAGRSFDFEMIRGEDDRWGALSSRGSLMVKVEANRFPIEGLSLVEITDVEPYLRGQDEFLRAIQRKKSR